MWISRKSTCESQWRFRIGVVNISRNYMNLRFIQVDAFADRPFTGNSAALIPLDHWLDDVTMQAIAMENNLAETAFTVPTNGDADYELRWFTPTTEVALCGHATLASGHVLLAGRASIRFRTRKSGILTVGNRGDALTLDLPCIQVETGQHPGLLEALGAPGAELFLSTQAMQATAIVMMKDETAVRACTPDMKALAAIKLMAIVTAPGGGEYGDYDVVSRVFVPAWGVDEDPVTGSAHAALSPFWAARLGRDNFTAYQASRRGGRVDCRIEDDRAILGGRCVTVIEGVMRL
jgi:PhzF family phenazine biosynthesis protein